MRLNFKNILAGVGGASILVIMILVGVVSRANLPISSDQEQVVMACPINQQTLDPDFRIPAIEENRPYAIHLDQDGNIYLALHSGNGYHKYDSNGNYIDFFNVSVYPPTDTLPAFFVTGDGMAYLLGLDHQTSHGFDNLYKIDSSGNASSVIDGIHAYQVAVDGDYVFALSLYKKVGNNNIVYLYKYKREGKDQPYKLVKEVAVGPVLYLYSHYTDIALSENYVFVADHVNAKLLKFNRENLDKEAEYSLPNFIPDYGLGYLRTYIDSNGNLYVAGPVADPNDPSKVIFRIVKMDPDGTILQSWDSPFGGEVIYDIAVSGDGFIYISKKDGVYKYGLLCGQITINKKADPQIDKEFTFSADLVKKENFALVDFPGKQSQKVFHLWNNFNISKLMSVEEDYDNKYQKLNISCDDLGVDIKDRKASFRLSRDENGGKISCVFENTFVPEGELQIKKTVSGNVSTGYFKVLLKKDGDLAFSKEFSLKHGETQSFSITSNGVYSIEEELMPNYVPEYLCKKNGIDLDYKKMEISRGERVECEIINKYTPPGVLKIKKTIQPSNYTQTFKFNLINTINNNKLEFNLLTTDQNYYKLTISEPGNYGLFERFDENQKSKFNTEYSCRDNNDNKVDHESMNIRPGVEITCDVINYDLENFTSDVTIIKDAIPNSTQSFTFDTSWGSSFTLVDFPYLKNRNIKIFKLKKGSYTITERKNPKYKTSVECKSGNDVVFTGENIANLDVGFKPITCVFTNTDISIDTGDTGGNIPTRDGGTD